MNCFKPNTNTSASIIKNRIYLYLSLMKRLERDRKDMKVLVTGATGLVGSEIVNFV